MMLEEVPRGKWTLVISFPDRLSGEVPSGLSSTARARHVLCRAPGPSVISPPSPGDLAPAVSLLWSAGLFAALPHSLLPWSEMTFRLPPCPFQSCCLSQLSLRGCTGIIMLPLSGIPQALSSLTVLSCLPLITGDTRSITKSRAR